MPYLNQLYFSHGFLMDSDTENKKYVKAQEKLDEMGPVIGNYSTELTKLILASPFRKELEDAFGSYLFKMFGAAALIYSRQGMERHLVNQETSMHYSDYYTFLMDVDSYFFSYHMME